MTIVIIIIIIIIIIVTVIWGSLPVLTSVILGMCAGRWGRNGSSQRRIGSPKFAKFRCRRDRGFYIGILRGLTPKSMVLYRALGRKNTSIDRRDLARKTVLGCCLRIAIAILCGFRIAIPAKQGPGPPEIEILLKNTLLAFICGCLLSQTIVPS